MSQLALNFTPPRPRGSRQPWQRMRSWRGGWWEGWCTDLDLECPDVGAVNVTVCQGGCVCKQEDLHEVNPRGQLTAYGRPYRRRARIRRASAGHARPWRVRVFGGEPSRVHAPPPSPLPTRVPAPVTLGWFLEHGWRGSRVERREVEGAQPWGSVGWDDATNRPTLGPAPKPSQTQFTLYHPSGAVLSLHPGVVHEEEGEEHEGRADPTETEAPQSDRP